MKINMVSFPPFFPGNFKAYTIKLDLLGGVYYCDIRPNMKEDAMLAQYIKTIDHFSVLMYGIFWRRVKNNSLIQSQPIADKGASLFYSHPLSRRKSLHTHCITKGLV